MKLYRFVIIITSAILAFGIFFPAYFTFLRSRLERNSSLMTSLTWSSMNKNKRDVNIDVSTRFGSKLLKLLKRNVIAVTAKPDDSNSKKIGSKNEVQPTFSQTPNATYIPSPTPQQSEEAAESDTSQILQQEEATLNKIIVVLCSLGASLVLVAIAIAILFWKVRRQTLIREAREDREAREAMKCNNVLNNQNMGDKNMSMSGSHDGSDDGTIIDVTVNVNDNINHSLDGAEYDLSTSLNAGVYYVNEENSLDTKHLKMPRQTTPSYPDYELSIIPSAPPAEEIAPHNELPDADTSNFSTSRLDPPAYSLYSPSAPPVYSLPDGPIIDSD